MKRLAPVLGGEATILLVDDSKLTREMLRLSLGKHGYRFITANNGREAMEVLNGHPEVDLIILDLVMPQMDGFEFLGWRLSLPEIQAIPVIVNSSLDDFASIARALTMDTYDYFTKPLSGRDLDLVLPIKIRNAVNTRRLMHETVRQYELMRRELAMAARYQEFLLPKDVAFSNIEVAYLFQPCTDVGGDYFDFFHFPEGESAFVVADVAGHGVASAMTASIIKALMPGYLERFRSPSRALTALNSDLLRLTQDDVFVTAFVGLYRPGERELLWASAGHPPPVLLKNGSPTCLLESKSTLLGVFEEGNPLLDYADSSLVLEPGDRLAIYTDGLIEAPNPQGVGFGLDTLRKILESERDLPIAQLKDVVLQILNDYVSGDLPDDVAFILMDFQP